MTDQLDTFEAARTEGIRDTVEFIMSQNPGMTWEQAEEEMRRNTQAEIARARVTRTSRRIDRATPCDTCSKPWSAHWGFNCDRPYADRKFKPVFAGIYPPNRHNPRKKLARRIRMARKRRRGW